MNRQQSSNQQGAALIIALILLLAMTVIALSASRNSVLQVQMSGNQRQKQVAFQSAELTLRGGENWLWDQGDAGKPDTKDYGDCTSNCDVMEAGEDPDPFSIDWTGSGLRVRAGPDLDNVGERPRYYIEEQQDVRLTPQTGRGKANTLQFYQVTAHGTGEDADVNAIVQSTFVLLF